MTVSLSESTKTDPRRESLRYVNYALIVAVPEGPETEVSRRKARLRSRRIYAWLDKSVASAGDPSGFPAKPCLAITLLESLYRYSAVKVNRDSLETSKC